MEDVDNRLTVAGTARILQWNGCTDCNQRNFSAGATEFHSSDGSWKTGDTFVSCANPAAF